MKLIVKPPAAAKLDAPAGYDSTDLKTPTRSLDGRMEFCGLPISIETGRSRTRVWYDPHSGTGGMSRMWLPYGYVRGTIGMDGDALDVFVGPWEAAPFVYAITTRKAPEFTATDEQKVFLGLRSAQEARDIFSKSYNDPRFFGSIKTIPTEEFISRIRSCKGRKITL